MSGFNMPPGVSPGDIPGNDDTPRFEGGAAFPSDEYGESGMSLRDYFAANAMNAYLSCDSWREDMDYVATARCTYAMADAMLKVRAE